MKNENPAIAFSRMPFGVYGNPSVLTKMDVFALSGPTLAMAQRVQQNHAKTQPKGASPQAKGPLPMAAGISTGSARPLSSSVDPRVVLGVIKPPNPYDD